MSEDIKVYETSEIIAPIDDDKLIAIAEQAEKRIEAMKKVKSVVMRLTNYRDWVDQSGKPYLWTSGAEKVARAFGISWRINDPEWEFLDGGHYICYYKGFFTLGGVTIEAIGSRSSKDGFFKKYDKSDKEKWVELPPSEIDKGDVKKSAFTNCIGNGVTRLLGIRNLTWEELDEAGIKRDNVTKIDHGTSKTERTGKISDAQRKRWYAIGKKAGWSDDEMKEYMLKTFNITTSNDILVSDYEQACEWAKVRPRQPGEDEA